jgi:hypothetical protein
MQNNETFLTDMKMRQSFECILKILKSKILTVRAGHNRTELTDLRKLRKRNFVSRL